MRNLPLSTLLLFTCITAPAQQATPSMPAAGSDWQHVQAIPVGTLIHVKTSSGSATCDLQSGTADRLICTHSKDLTFQFSEIKRVQIAHRSRSRGLGAVIGAGVGVIAVEAAWNRSWAWPAINRGTVAVVGGLGFAIPGAIVGHFTDFTASTVYKAP